MYEIGEREAAAVRKVILSGKLFRYHQGHNAPETGRFEKALARKLDSKYALAMTSGTSALICALTGLGIGPGDEVIIPGYTFIATALAPVAVGAVPIIAEVNDSLTIDPADIERKITRYTKAIIPVHMCGLPCDMSAIMRIARRHRLKVIEDACQADGGSYRGRRLGAIGDAGVLSFNFYKIISSGEGGAMVTNDEKIFQRALIQHDAANPFFMDESPAGKEIFAGLNFRITEIQSAILNVQMGRLDGILRRLRQRRRAIIKVLQQSDAFRLAPSNDTDGDCGVAVPVQFDTAEEASAFVEKHAKSWPMFRPIDSGRHVYSNWEAILQKKSHHPKLNPWKMHRRKISYSKRMCPQTLEILSQTVLVRVPLAKSLTEIRSEAKHLIGAK